MYKGIELGVKAFHAASSVFLYGFSIYFGGGRRRWDGVHDYLSAYGFGAEVTYSPKFFCTYLEEAKDKNGVSD